MWFPVEKAASAFIFVSRLCSSFRIIKGKFRNTIESSFAIVFWFLFVLLTVRAKKRVNYSCPHLKRRKNDRPCHRTYLVRFHFSSTPILKCLMYAAMYITLSRYIGKMFGAKHVFCGRSHPSGQVSSAIDSVKSPSKIDLFSGKIMNEWLNIERTCTYSSPFNLNS